jgi:integrase
MLDRRWAEGVRLDDPLFPDTEGGWRDPSNTSRMLRQARGSKDFAWVTSHVFRKTAATILDEAGLSARAVADQLGHARPSMTQDVYLARRMLNPRAAEALERVFESKPGAQ